MFFQKNLYQVKRFAIIFVILMSSYSLKVWASEPDLILHNAIIYNKSYTKKSLKSIAVKEGKISEISSSEHFKSIASANTKIIDLKQKLLLPGFIESHGHLMGVGKKQLFLDFTGTKSEVEIVGMVADRVKKMKPGEWLLGRGWDQNNWLSKDFPTHHLLSKVAPDNPVKLTRIDGHAAWYNQKALAVAGITKETQDPSGGSILRDYNKDATGVLVDTAMSLVNKHIPPLTLRQKKEALNLGIQQALALGITTFHDAGIGEETLRIYKEMAIDGNLPIRINGMIDGSDSDLAKKMLVQGPLIGFGDSYLTVRSFKLMADGALGSRGAALNSEYHDHPGHKGKLILSEGFVHEFTLNAIRRGYQVAVHAIGDRANEMVLDAFERVRKQNPEIVDARLRIEHAQLISSRDQERFKDLGIIASMQPTHCTSDMPWAGKRIGAKRVAEMAYVWRNLLDKGVVIAAGSDAPVESLNPLWGIYSAVTRKDHSGRPAKGWNESQKLTRAEAVQAYTLGGAYAAFEEGFKGILREGSLADFVVLSRDIFVGSSNDILKAKVENTIVGGKVFDSKKYGDKKS